MPNRLMLVCVALFCSALLLGQTEEGTNPSPQIVFVCEHGAAKSIIAVAEFNQRAAQNGLPLRAVSRGTNPDPKFASGVVAGLSKDGFSIPAGKPQLLTEGDVKNADRVITLGCKLPDRLNSAAKPTDWSDISSPSASYDAARKDIGRHIEELISDLLRERAKK
jgi:arsenate reductase (thioredoxin)